MTGCTRTSTKTFTNCAAAGIDLSRWCSSSEFRLSSTSSSSHSLSVSFIQFCCSCLEESDVSYFSLCSIEDGLDRFAGWNMLGFHSLCFLWIVVFAFITNMEKTLGNIFMWLTLFMGTGLFMSLYSMEWYARINCPPSFVSSVTFFFKIRPWFIFQEIIYL